MDFLEIAKKRYFVRSYLDRKVETEKLEKVLQAAHVAPTAANLQPVHLIAVQGKEGLEKNSKAANIYGAPLAVIVCADHEKAWVRSGSAISNPISYEKSFICRIILNRSTF